MQAPPTGPEGELPGDAEAALRSGDKIEAIRKLREATGLGLKEAKDAVDAREAGLQGNARVPAMHASASGADGELPGGADAPLIAGRKIEAIKLLRGATGMGLKDAKEAVEARETVLRAQGRMKPGKNGCAGAVLLAAALAASAGVAVWMIA